MISSLGEYLLEDRLHEVGVDREVAISAYPYLRNVLRAGRVWLALYHTYN
jgi:hypothetical protein